MKEIVIIARFVGTSWRWNKQLRRTERTIVLQPIFPKGEPDAKPPDAPADHPQETEREV